MCTGQGLGQRVKNGSNEYFTIVAGRQYSFTTWAFDEYNNRQTTGTPGFIMNSGDPVAGWLSARPDMEHISLSSSDRLATA